MRGNAKECIRQEKTGNMRFGNEFGLLSSLSFLLFGSFAVRTPRAFLAAAAVFRLRWLAASTMAHA